MINKRVGIRTRAKTVINNQNNNYILHFIRYITKLENETRTNVNNEDIFKLSFMLNNIINYMNLNKLK